MIHLVTESVSTYGRLDYAADNALAREDFWNDVSLKSFTGTLRYRLKRTSGRAWIERRHIIESAAGPTLVSDAFRATIERVAGPAAEFIPAEIDCDGERLTRFSAINLIWREPCIDLAASEYRPANFDPANPRYTFDDAVLRPDWEAPTSIAVCAEMPGTMAVREALKQACFEDGLRGLVFCRALDMTHGNRTVETRIL